MSISNFHQQDKMKIQHITHDETQTRQSMSRRASDASMKIKNYLSRRLLMFRHSDAETPLQHPSPRTNRPVTNWPQSGTQSSLHDKPSDMTAYLTKQYHEEKAAQRDEKLIVKAINNGSYLPLGDTNDAPFLRFRRKSNFTNAVMENLNMKSTDSQQQNTDGKGTMEILYKLRKAMKDGRLEQVVPPGQPSRTKRRLAPPQNQFVDQSPRVSGESSRARSSSCQCSSSHQHNSSQSCKTKSSSSRIADCIRTSADILDEKRRDVQSKFQAPFEHLNYASFSLSRRVSITSSQSAESFWCVGEGEEEQKSNTQSIHALKARQQASAGMDSRLSGVGATLRANHVAENCKLCGKFAMTGLQGLCEACESDFNRPRAPGIEHTNQYPDSEWEDDIRPTPPLKDRKTLSLRRERDLQRHFQVDTDGLEDERPPPVPLKDMGSRLIFKPVPWRDFSQTAQIEDSDERYLNWKRSSQQDEFAKTQSVLERCSLSFENDDLGNRKGDDKVPLIEGKRTAEKKDLDRDANFYRFYDEVLDDH